MDREQLWNLKWGVETSTRYHDWRRSRLWTIVRINRTVTLAGAVVALVTVFSSWSVPIIVGVASAVIAIVNLLDLVENYTGKAQKHEELYRRFKALQADIELHAAEPEKYITEWEAKAQIIRADEPPTHWAIYASSWNQTIERNAAERKGYYRRVTWWQRLLSGVLYFNPQDFPAAPAK